MKQTTIRTFALLCLVALFFSGCSKKTEAAPIGSEVWDEMPALTYGVMEYDKLEVLPWDNGRFEATGRNKVAETEKGYYLLENSRLLYADKANLQNWVVVCKQPDCLHGATSECGAYIGGTSFLVRDGRILNLESALAYPELYQRKANGDILLSRALDGTDKKLAFALEDAMMSSGGGNYSAHLSPDGLLYNVMEMDANGTYHGKSFFTTPEGTSVLFDEPVAQTRLSLVGLAAIRGDQLFENHLWGDNISCYYSIRSGKVYEYDLSRYEGYGKYLSGEILRCFKKNDGYYDVDLQTGEEVFVAAARLHNSGCTILLPNCIIESTLDYAVKDEQRGETAHEVEVFDGNEWKAVVLPDELRYAEAGVTLSVRGIASDCIFFSSYQEGTCKVYRIELNKEALTMELCGQLAV